VCGRRRLPGANTLQENVAEAAAERLFVRSNLGGGVMISRIPPPGLALIDVRKLTRLQRRAIKRAHRLDCDFFRQNPLRLTRVRRAVDGETGTNVSFPGKQCFAVVRQVRPRAFHTLLGFTRTNLLEVASSESAAAKLYDQLLEADQREWAVKWKQQALGELLAFAPVRGSA
jgi:hypothetical protein